jgi:hypothetical protein
MRGSEDLFPDTGVGWRVGSRVEGFPLKQLHVQALGLSVPLTNRSEQGVFGQLGNDETFDGPRCHMQDIGLLPEDGMDHQAEQDEARRATGTVCWLAWDESG